MQYTASPASIHGQLQAPASKSVAQRAIAIAALTRGESFIDYPGRCDDVLAAIRVVRQLGVTVEETSKGLRIQGGISQPKQPLNCGEAGLGIRMFSGVVSTLDQEVVLTGEGSLMNRPMQVVEESLSALGVSCTTSNGRLPLTVKGPILGGTAIIDGSLSSQVLTGILIAAPFARHDVKLQVENLKSMQYIDVTTDVMRDFGVRVINHDYKTFTIKAGQVYQPTRIQVDGDWSGAAFLLVAGAIAGHVVVDNLNNNSNQPDKKILSALRAAGAIVSVSDNAVEVHKQNLVCFDFDATNCPDLFPPLAALAANCKGISNIRGADRLRAKESDRAATLMNIFSTLGVHIDVENDIMKIHGGQTHGGIISSHGDHRIAMAGTIAALTSHGHVVIDDAEAVNKSYPEFFEEIDTIRC